MAKYYCSFCDKSNEDGTELILMEPFGNAGICSECIDFCIHARNEWRRNQMIEFEREEYYKKWKKFGP